MITLEDVMQAAVEHQRQMRKDPTLVVHLYADKGWQIARIARHVGLDRSTVYRRLEKAGVYKGPGTPGPPRKDRCQRDHDMTVWGVEIGKARGGGRYCRKCKQLRERVG